MIWGIPVLIWLEKKGEGSRWYRHGLSTLTFLFFSGLLSLSFISSWLVLWIPLQFNILTGGTLALLLLLLIFFRSNMFRVMRCLAPSEGGTWIHLTFLSCCILLFVILGCLMPVNIDTQLYHLQAIRWTHEFGTVPGLANLYPRLGLLSGWFNLVSLFYMPFFNHQNFTFLNTTVTIWFLIWLVCKLIQNYHSNTSIRAQRAFPFLFLFLILYFLYDWQLFRDTANSTSYDFIVTSLTLMLVVFFAEEFLSTEKPTFSPAPVVIALLIIPFKLSGIFILFPVVYYLWRHRSWAAWLQSILAGIIILAPLLIRNYIVSGYPLYPSLLSAGTPDWQLPREMAMKFREHIIYVNKFYNQEVSFIMNYHKQGFNWISFWLQGILVKHKILLCLSMASSLLFFFRPFTALYTSMFRYYVASLWLMLTGWFLIAPDPRFAYGFLLFLAFFPIALTAARWVIPVKLINPVLLFAALPVLLYTVRKPGVFTGGAGIWLSVTGTVSPPYHATAINGFIYHAPEKINDNWNNRCFYTPLPCLCEPNPYLRTRSGKLKDGFTMNPAPDSIFISNYTY